MVVVALVDALVDAAVRGWDPVHHAIHAALAVSAVAAAWRWSDRRELLLGAALVAWGWSAGHGAKTPVLAWGLAPAAIMHAPASIRRVRSSIAAAAAGAAGWSAHVPWVGVISGAVVAGGVAASWPSEPTQQALARIRRAALTVAPAGLALVLVVNVVTGRADAVEPVTALGWGLGLAALFLLVAAAGLGLETMTASNEVLRASAWSSAAAAAGIAMAMASDGDPGAAVGAIAASFAVVAPLAVVGSLRVAAGAPAWGRWIAVVAPGLLGAAQAALPAA